MRTRYRLGESKRQTYQHNQANLSEQSCVKKGSASIGTLLNESHMVIATKEKRKKKIRSL